MTEDDSIHKAELRQHLKDVDKDILKAEQELAALLDLRDWLRGEVETRKSVTLADVRDWLVDCTSGAEEPATVAEIANGIGCSASQLRNKKFLDQLLSQGTIIKVVSDLHPVRYKFDDFEHPIVKPRRYKRKHMRLAYSSGGEVAGTGQQRLRGRKAEIKKGRRGHR